MTASSATFTHIHIEATQPAERVGEPVSCGIPWPRGELKDLSPLRLRDPQGNLVPLQMRVLDRWPDGSVRWVLLDWQATVVNAAAYRLSIASAEEPPAAASGHLRVHTAADVVHVKTGTLHCECRPGIQFFSISDGGPAPRFSVVADSHLYQPHITRVHVEESGSLRAVIKLEGEFVTPGAEPLAKLVARLHFFSNSSTVKVVVTVHNPRKAEHPGGLWDLGNGGSIYLRDASLSIPLPPGAERPVVRCSPEPGMAAETRDVPLEIYQDSSGGKNWQSTNHVNRNHVVPNSFCGYRLRAGTSETSGKRATPIVSIERGDMFCAVAMPYFWQNFPKAIEAGEHELILRLFPKQYGDVHEIQGGEQKTHTFYVAFGPERVTSEPLAWCRSPLLARAVPEWYCNAGVIPFLIPAAEDPNAQYLQLVNLAIAGEDTFEHKREVVDEYGWRHFGDIYGDHEAVSHKGPQPLVSHYNNQYDPIAGFAFQFLRSGDPRWWKQMNELAAHVIDIDIYHTDLDKSAYNHGLFWHTVHYVDADTGTHRSYPRAAKVCGGGPGNEQNYTTGLMLHHFLTGDPASREAATGLARWVIDQDDGSRTVFRLLAGGDTGLASASRTPSYHGPGRGGANSIAALIDGHRLTQDRVFLDKAEQLIRRCIHPADNIPARNLLDTENRWFYTMFLQSLARYLDYKAELGQVDRMYAYAQASLLHYVRWMAEHEYPYLEKPEILEYPTETWPAQDMRKSEIFKHAARHTTGAERQRFLERSEFFLRYSTSTLAGMKTRSLARPVVLLLSFGFMHAFFQKHPGSSAPQPGTRYEFGQPEVFVPQKARAKRRLKALVVLGAVALLALAIYLII